MARANLNITEELTSAFLAAQDGSVRYLRATIQKENIELIASEKMQNNSKSDFEDMASTIEKGTPQYFLYLDNPDTKKWTLISYVPEYSNVRMKMLFSSSRDDLKRNLGLIHFDGDFQVTEPEELSYELFLESKSKHKCDGPLTMREEIIREEKLATKSTTPSSAMGNVAFPFSNELANKLEEFKSGSIKWVEISIDTTKETTELKNSKPSFSVEDLHSLIVSEPRFYLCHVKNQGCFFIYCCPDDFNVRTRMMYASCKSYITETIEQAKISCDKKIEISEASDLIDEITDTSEVDATMGSSDPVFAKPSGPGGRRGKKRGMRNK